MKHHYFHQSYTFYKILLCIFQWVTVFILNQRMLLYVSYIQVLSAPLINPFEYTSNDYYYPAFAWFIYRTCLLYLTHSYLCLHPLDHLFYYHSINLLLLYSLKRRSSYCNLFVSYLQLSSLHSFDSFQSLSYYYLIVIYLSL